MLMIKPWLKENIVQRLRESGTSHENVWISGLNDGIANLTSTALLACIYLFKVNNETLKTMNDVLNVFKVNKDAIVWKSFTFNKYWNRVSLVFIYYRYYYYTYYIYVCVYIYIYIYVYNVYKNYINIMYININKNTIGAAHMSNIKD